MNLINYTCMMQNGHGYRLWVGILALAIVTACSSGPADPKALFQSIEGGDLDLVKRLAASGIDLDQLGDEGYSALMLAAHRGNDDVVRVLVKEGADPDFKDMKGRTALMYALSGKQMETARLLAGSSTDLETTDQKGNTPLHYAARLDLPKFITFLVEDKRVSEIDPRNRSGKTPLMLAAQHGHTAAVQRLLDLNADTEATDKKGNTALIHAAKREHYPIMVGLVFNSPTHGIPELIQFSREGHEEAVAFLLQKVTDIDRYVEGETALMAAAYNGRPEIVRLLTAYGADTELRNDQGLTPLGIAALQGHTETVHALLEAGANPSPDGDISPRDLALQTGHNAVAKLLSATDDRANPNRYYHPLVDTYQSEQNIVERTEHYLLFESAAAAAKGTDIDRLKKEKDILYLHYKSPLSQCREELTKHLEASETSARKRREKKKEPACQSAGKTYEMAFMWHCYVDDEKSQEQGCEVISCYTHFVCR